MSRFKIQRDELEIEPDAIVDTQEHDLYECRTWAMSELCDLLNQQDEKIKGLENRIKKLDYKNQELFDLNVELCEENGKQKFNQTKLAIEELEKIGNILVAYSGAINNPDGSIKKYDCVIPYHDFDNYLTQRIKELKGV